MRVRRAKPNLRGTEKGKHGDCYRVRYLNGPTVRLPVRHCYFDIGERSSPARETEDLRVWDARRERPLWEQCIFIESQGLLAFCIPFRPRRLEAGPLSHHLPPHMSSLSGHHPRRFRMPFRAVLQVTLGGSGPLTSTSAHHGMGGGYM